MRTLGHELIQRGNTRTSRSQKKAPTLSNLWPICGQNLEALDCYAMGADVKECKNPRKYLVAATFEKTKTYAFAVVSDYESHALTS